MQEIDKLKKYIQLYHNSQEIAVNFKMNYFNEGLRIVKN